MLRYQFGSDRADGAQGGGDSERLREPPSPSADPVPAARVEAADGGPILPPSRPHVAARAQQELV